PEASIGGLQGPNSKPQVVSPVEEGDAAARPVPGVSAAQSPATDLETSGGDAGDETADRPASLSADLPPAADKPLFASVDQPAFVEILENAGHTKSSQALPPSVPTGLVKQLAERAALSIKEGTSEIRIALKPEALGHLQMAIATENQQVAVKVIVGTHLVKALLDQNLTQLKHLLQEQGLLLDKFDVLVAQDSSQSGSGRQSAGNAQAQRTDRNNGDPETDAGTRQEHEAAPRRQREDNARIDYFA
ncbi:MAG: flagellar hook-length control protein FliK, partial [Desulfobacterales bacterium]|nr:flagellar hook-length control protein FliK [Desulfobacterales bacterium]